MKYAQAIGKALRVILDQDPDAVLIGTDIGRSGGVFGVTRGLWEDFGDDRIIDMPIAEMGTIGLAVGAAMTGLRPIVELMYLDFIGVCLDQLMNQAAKVHQMSGGRIEVPLVIRSQFGAGGRAGPQHSQSLEGILAAIPGLTVICPSTARDAYGLLLSAAQASSPVIFLENRRLYGYEESIGDEDLSPIPIGSARVCRAGSDATCVTYSRMTHLCRQAADHLYAEYGLSIEIIDLRTLYPIDLDTVFASVRRTGKLLVAHEAVKQFGPGAEIAAKVAEKCFDQLDGPISRIGAPRSAVPFSPPLEDAYLPSLEQIQKAMLDLARW